MKYTRILANALGTHKGYIADVGYDSGDEETHIDIIYEDEDVETTTVAEALQKRSFHQEGRSREPDRTFELVPGANANNTKAKTALAAVVFTDVYVVSPCVVLLPRPITFL